MPQRESALASVQIQTRFKRRQLGSILIVAFDPVASFHHPDKLTL